MKIGCCRQNSKFQFMKSKLQKRNKSKCSSYYIHQTPFLVCFLS
uniref:Uncharacterized protein n=1 Tax=Rhizophora mucronata TaxID=61149 RepID=A0A2P2PHR7_RHIMU